MNVRHHRPAVIRCGAILIAALFGVHLAAQSQSRELVWAGDSEGGAPYVEADPSFPDRVVGFEVDSETGRDVRRDLARAVVASGWGLLEMRPMRMSLEDVFLSLTTEESATPPAAAEVEPEGETVHE